MYSVVCYFSQVLILLLMRCYQFFVTQKWQMCTVREMTKNYSHYNYNRLFVHDVSWVWLIIKGHLSQMNYHYINIESNSNCFSRILTLDQLSLCIKSSLKLDP